jgi:hypothetical protein
LPASSRNAAKCWPRPARPSGWGPFSVNPLLPEAERETNLAWILREMADLKDAIRDLQEAVAAELGPGPYGAVPPDIPGVTRPAE